MSAASFALEIDRDLAKSEDEFRLIIAKAAIDADGRIVDRTPVDTGRARGNWIASIGGRATATMEVFDPSGSGAKSEGASVIAGFMAREDWPSIFIQNNLPYIGRLEDGYSGQAPNGMLAVTFAELKAVFA